MTAPPKRPWFRFSPRTLLPLPVLVLLSLGTLMAVWPTVSDCGGNNPVMTQERIFLEAARYAALISPDRRIVITSLSPEQQECFAHWQGDPALLVSTKPLPFDEPDTSDIFIVCSEAHTNRPKWWWEARAPLHAVGYADGGIGLISVEQFKRLDRSHFVPVPTTLEEKPVTRHKE